MEVRPYDRMTEDIRALASVQTADASTRIMLDPTKVSFALAEAATNAYHDHQHAIGAKKRKLDGGAEGYEPILIEGLSPVVAAKALKNPVELEGIREAHIRDGVALAEFFHWLEGEVKAGKALTEVDVDTHLLAARKRQAGFIEPSFPTIAGSGPNGAIIHYRAKPGPMNRAVTVKEMLLVDSGGQYECGTTDVTRTVHFGTPTEFERRCFTAVLKV